MKNLIKLVNLTIDNKGHYGIGASSSPFDKNYPEYLRITDISDDGRIQRPLPTSINIIEYPNYNEYFLKKNDIVFARTGNSTGRNYFYDGEPNKIVYAGFLIKYSLDESLIIPKYVSYYCQSQNFYNIIEGKSNGSTRKNFNAKSFGDIKIPVFDHKLQQHIVDTIGSIDDLIELNEKIFNQFNNVIHILIKKYAFRTNNFVKLKDLIYKVGKTCKNGEWKKSIIIDLSTMPEDNIVINSYNDGSLFNTNIKTLDEHALLYGSIRPYFHKCGFTTDIKFVAGTVHSFKVFNEKMYYWILGIISSDDFHRHTNTKSQGTKMPIINWEAFIDYDVPIIDDDSLIQFNEIIDPLYKIIIEKMKQNRKLECIKKQYLNKFFG